MKWMYLSGCILFKDNLDWIFFFSTFPFLERKVSMVSMDRQGFCHKDIIALENGHLLPFLSHVYEWAMWIPYLVLLTSVLIFHHWDFYGTDSIPEKYSGRNLIFQVQKFLKEWTIYSQPATFMGIIWSVAPLSCGKDVTNKR